MTNFIPEREYEELHKTRLQPTSIKIDPEKFEQEIQKYNKYFRPWGDKFHEMPRYGLPLVNDNGRLDNNIEPACYPLDRWNFLQLGYEDTPEEFTKFYKSVETNAIKNIKTDVDFTTPTEVLNLPSLKAMNPIKPYLVRSCILKWGIMAHFKPHFDVWHPVKWLRLWGTTRPDQMYLRYKIDHTDNGFCIWNETHKKFEVYEAEEQVEAGRLYLHDSMIWHDAFSFGDPVYQFFIAISIGAVEWLEQNLI